MRGNVMTDVIPVDEDQLRLEIQRHYAEVATRGIDRYQSRISHATASFSWLI